MQLSHTPPLPVNQSVRGDMPNDARPSSDEDEGQSGIRSSPYIRPHSTTEPTRSSGLHSRPLQSGPICTTPGMVEHRLSDRIKQKQKRKQKSLHQYYTAKVYYVTLNYCAETFADCVVIILAFF